jgi:alpha-tubulin suppressor-like RCC1 family protein
MVHLVPLLARLFAATLALSSFPLGALLGCGRSEGAVLDPICAPGACADAGSTSSDASVGDAPLSASPAITLTASANATCATLLDGTLRCWGENTDGALVSGSTANVVSPARIGADADWVEVGGAHGHCARKRNDALYCWGPDYAVPATASVAAPTPVEPSIAWAHAAGGAQHHCALARDQSLYCWGINDHGQLGLGDTAARTAATRLADFWVEASVGASHTCARKADGSLWCWGQNGQGQLGLGDENDRITPTRVGASSDWASVSAGGNHTCAIETSGALWCWGENAYGEVGTGDVQVQTAPVHLGTATYRAVASGSGLSCAVAADGTLWCWGDFGQAVQPGESRTPQRVDGNTDWTQVVAGFSHACGVRGQSVYCLGWDFDGQLAQPASTTYTGTATLVAF